MSSPALAPEPLWTAEDVAAFLKVSVSMVYKLRRERKITGVQVGTLWRFHPHIVRSFAEGVSPEGPGAPVVPIAGRRRRV